MGLKPLAPSAALYVETSVLLIAAGVMHPQRAACQGVLDSLRTGRRRLHTSVEGIQEFVFHRTRRGDLAVGMAQAEGLANSLVLHHFDEAVLLEALRLMKSTPVRGRDAVHAATAMLAGFDRIVTLDSDFDSLPGLAAVTPAEVLAEA